MFYEHELQHYWLHHANLLEGLRTNTGQPLTVIHPGVLNHDQGPDFINAKIKIDDVVWVGKIEIHVYASDWVKHYHHADSNYQSIILHVVWKNDLTEFGISPVLELSHFLEKDFLQFRSNASRLSYLQCSQRGLIHLDVSEHEELGALGLKRLNRHKDRLLLNLSEYKNDFSATLWRHVFRAFGRSANADFFESLFTSIPIHLLRLYGFESRKIEALLFGQAGLLQDKYEEHYPRQLYQEYLLLQSRHDLKPVLGEVKFLRMRPRNFPTIRIAQLSAFYQLNMPLVRVLLTIEDVKEVFQLFDVLHNPYWNNHFRFDRLSVDQFKEIGYGLRQQIVLNAFIPFLMAYGERNCQNHQVQKAMQWMTQLKPEQNAIISEFSKLGFCSSSMKNTQSLLELYASMCLQNRCSECIRGKELQMRLTN